MNEKQILFVDDERWIRELLVEAFSRSGYAARGAESAEDALEILKDEMFHVLFLDLNLPGMNGIDLCRRIRKDSPLAVIYALTGYGSLFELTDCREAGFDDYFTKPASLDDLFDAAENAFGKLERWKSS